MSMFAWVHFLSTGSLEKALLNSYKVSFCWNSILIAGMNLLLVKTSAFVEYKTKFDQIDY